MRGFGILVVIVGLGGMLYALGMDTSVSVSDVDIPHELRPYVPSAMRVNNLGLMQQRQNYLMVGGVAAVIGAIFVAVGFIAGVKHSEQHPPDQSATFLCPQCNRTIYNRVPECPWCKRALSSEEVEAAILLYSDGPPQPREPA